EETFRKSGGLRQELKALADGLGGGQLIYGPPLEEAEQRAALLLCGVDLETALDAQGKAALRRAVLDGVERLRRATHDESPSLLRALRRAAADLAGVAGLPAQLTHHLAAAAAELADIIARIRYAGDDNDDDGSGSDSGGGGGRSGGRSGRAGAHRGRSTRGGGAPSVRSASRTAMTACGGGGGGSGAGGWESFVNVDMPAVRAVQKRLGLLAGASDLTDGVKARLRNVAEDLARQNFCNAAVDDAVEGATAAPLAAHDAAQRELADHALFVMEDRAAAAAAATERMCTLWGAAAAAVAEHGKRTAAIDKIALDEMFDCKEDFRLADEDREAEMAAATKRLRQAPNEHQLNATFEEV
ncbi:unnamed protein product, partial [Phaeothamnion confervicola]